MKGIENYDLISVFDYSGKSQQVTHTLRNQDMLEIDMSALSSGTYFIKVVINYNSRTFTVIKR
ncbi:MAG: T9SS type A sorting domain-containing protein [Bacteroidales bacterium]|nr:T9SS type A sorting domain-containing protein [Bacteroidales bacterium]